MNFTPLDSSRQRASFQIKIFAKFAKKFFFNFRRFLAQKKLLDERNPTVPNSSLVGRLITELWPFEILKLSNGHNSVIKQATAMNFTPLVIL
jgi:hypothetical protein